MNTRLLRVFRKLGVSLVSPRVFYAGAMVALGSVIIGILIWWLVSREQTQKLTLYSGQSGGTYKPLAEEIAKLLEREDPTFEIEVIESEGSIANLRKLTTGQDSRVLGIVQNDIEIPPELDPEQASAVRSLLPLHSGVLHFIVPADSTIQSISDLRGKRIAEGLHESGSPPIVDALLAHYELPLDSIERQYLSLKDACSAFRNGETDAILMAMGLKSAEFEKLITDVPVRVVGIGQTIDPGSEIEGFRLTYPFVQATYVPKYAYSAPSFDRPGVPDGPVPSIAVRAVLIAHRDLPDLLATRIARTLVENKSSLSRSHPSAAQITEHFDPAQLQFPIHQGAYRYFHRDDPSFLRRNAELFGFALSLVIAFIGFMLSARRWMTQRLKDRIDAYYIELDQLLDPLYDPNADRKDLQQVDSQLLDIQRKAIRHLASDRLIADESFRIFQGLLSEGRQEAERRLRELDSSS